jgi:HlyD family secretion protein
MAKLSLTMMIQKHLFTRTEVMKAFLKKINHWKLPVLALIGLTLALVTVISRKPDERVGPSFQPPVAQYPQNMAGIGVIEPSSEIISIGAELSGIVRHVHVKVNQQVKAGEPLFSLDERDASARIKVLEANLDSVKIQAADAKAQFDIANAIDDKRALAKDEFNRRKFAFLLADKRVKETQAELNQARVNKERLIITAPITGEVLSINVRSGEFAQAGVLSEPLMRFGKTDVLHVRVEIDEEKASYVMPTSPAKGFTRGSTDKPLALKFVRFEPFVRPKQNLAVVGQRVDTRVLQVIYALDSAESHIFVGQQLDVFIQAGRRP